MGNGKGGARRKAAVSYEQYSKNWDRIFGKEVNWEEAQQNIGKVRVFVTPSGKVEYRIK